jgi:hypothetical protein
MTYVQGDHARYNSTLASQAGTFATSNTFTGATFAGVFGTITAQSYGSKQQYGATSPQELKPSVDFRHTNPGEGSGGFEQYIQIDPTSYSLVSGFSTVYHVTPAGGLTVNEANYKAIGAQCWAGRYLCQDMSGPSSLLSDSSPYQHCVALKAGECVPTSSAGQFFAAVPYVPNVSSQTACVSGWYTENYICGAVALPFAAGWLVQNDNSYSYGLWEGGRRLTMAFSGYGRQYELNVFSAENTGQWGLFKSDWTDLLRSEIFMVKFPPFPGGNSIPRSTFVNLPVGVPAGMAYAEIKFGMLENGASTAFYCTQRAEVCTTSGSPFAYQTTDAPLTLTSCGSGCLINIPVIPGRTVYFEVCRSASSSGSGEVCGPLQVEIAPGG